MVAQQCSSRSNLLRPAPRGGMKIMVLFRAPLHDEEAWLHPSPASQPG